jgi:hypothetical protein
VLLGAHSPGQPLQPYIPRDADSRLDLALVGHSLVFVVHGSASGARRTVYEALLRNHPDHCLAIEDGPAEDDTAPDNTVLWMDVTNRRSDILMPDQLMRWLKPGRRAVIIVNRNYRQLADLREAFAELDYADVLISNRLSDAEQAAARQLDEEFAGDSVDDLITAAAAAPPTPLVAGYHADTDDGPDFLGITQDVHMLAGLVVSRHVRPPLSVGLFGNWGSGKSFFMKQMRRRVRVLADAAAAEEERVGRCGPTVSTYCSTVRQITFNAWHYAEANLWASLATHIFDDLASEGSEEVLRRRADELAEQRGKEQSLLKQLSMVRLERMLVAAQQDSKPVFPELTAEDRDWIARETNLPADTTENVRKFVTELRGLGSEVRQTWHLLRRSRLALAACVVGIAAAIGVAFLVSSPAWPLLVGLVPVLVGVTPQVTRVREAAQRIRRAAEHVTTANEQRLAELDEEAARLEREVAELASQHDAMAFAKSRHASEDYRQHLGIVSQLRRDLELFAAMIDKEPDDLGGLERVVLYIDDLDRCPPDVVIKVLEAIHLLVALPVFVVVVAVDPRWLHQAIRHHYKEMLPHDVLTPDHYLEKIFQIPFQLPAMDVGGFGRLMLGLAAHRTTDATPDSNTPAETPPEPARTEQDEPEATVVTSQPATVRDLRPRQLDISNDELEFLGRLASMVTTPRTAKRVLNLYRLLRARLSDNDVERFMADGEYQAVLVLLALQAESGASSLDEFESKNNLSWISDRLKVDVAWSVYPRWVPLVRRFSFGQRGTAPDDVGGGRSDGDG